MIFPEDKLREVADTIDAIINKISEFEHRYRSQIENVHPNYTKSARNLVHYLAFRSFNIDVLQKKLDEIRLPNTATSENCILDNLLHFKTIINSLLGEDLPYNEKIYLTKKEAENILKQHARAIFGAIQNERKTAILVTQPTIAATDRPFVKSLLKAGMDSARINCAHDSEIVWKQIIDTIKELESECKIMMDLGGPKLRTGKMKPGPKVIHIKPKRNTLGQVTAPAKIWLAPYGIQPPEGEKADAIIPVNKKWLRKTRKGSYIVFRDSRNKKCRIFIDEKVENGRWASCSDSAFVTTGTLLNVFLEKKSTSEIHTVHELLPLAEAIFLSEGDFLRLDRKPILGEPAVYDQHGIQKEIAHISCTLPEIFDMVNIGDQIYFDDGKLEGIIRQISPEHVIVEITSTQKKGGKLKADKGINLPTGNSAIRGLTEKDKVDLRFVVKHADAVNFSFVNNANDVEDLLQELTKLNAQIGIILKIETEEAFKNLPSIILKAMENYPIGVMIARGDLAIETGWKNFAIIQEEILRLCDAAHLPDIWATQVLENLAKKGVPTRAEISDVALAQRAECVMLNKGPYIEKAVKMLDKVLGKLQRIRKDQTILLPKLEFNEIP